MSTTLTRPSRAGLSPALLSRPTCRCRIAWRLHETCRGRRGAFRSGHPSPSRVASEMRLEHWCAAPQLFVRKVQAGPEQPRPEGNPFRVKVSKSPPPVSLAHRLQQVSDKLRNRILGQHTCPFSSRHSQILRCWASAKIGSDELLCRGRAKTRNKCKNPRVLPVRCCNLRLSPPVTFL